jgi:dTMP kinase
MLIVIEGVDGSGKSTMAKELHKYCTNVLKIKSILLKFPMYESPYGKIIARYLNGEFDPNLNYWIISTLYDCDKFNYKLILQDHIKNHDIVILDRYYLSNIAYSCAKMKDKEDTNSIIMNLWYLNNNIFEMPKPTLTFLMDIDNGNYLKIKKNRDQLEGNDIHEQDLQLINDTIKIYKYFDNLDYIDKLIKIPYISIENRLQLMINHLGTL